MNKQLQWLAVVAMSIACGLAGAHHSTANFDMTTQVSITGTATSFAFMNPHSLVKMDVKDATGAVQHYSVFLTSRAALVRYNWRPSSIKPGDTITITGAPNRGDPLHIYLLKITFADGKEWGRDEILQ